MQHLNLARHICFLNGLNKLILKTMYEMGMQHSNLAIHINLFNFLTWTE